MIAALKRLFRPVFANGWRELADDALALARELSDENDELTKEIESLRHDLDRYMAIANAEAREVERLRAILKEKAP